MKAYYAYGLSFVLAMLTASLNAYGYWMIHVERQEYPVKLGIISGLVLSVVMISLIIVLFKRSWRIGTVINLVASYLLLLVLVGVFVVQWALYGTTL
jgi:hypothetical protein